MTPAPVLQEGVVTRLVELFFLSLRTLLSFFSSLPNPHRGSLLLRSSSILSFPPPRSRAKTPRPIAPDGNQRTRGPDGRASP